MSSTITARLYSSTITRPYALPPNEGRRSLPLPALEDIGPIKSMCRQSRRLPALRFGSLLELILVRLDLPCTHASHMQSFKCCSSALVKPSLKLLLASTKVELPW